jgi:hypothetical protein
LSCGGKKFQQRRMSAPDPRVPASIRDAPGVQSLDRYVLLAHF